MELEETKVAPLAPSTNGKPKAGRGRPVGSGRTRSVEIGDSGAEYAAGSINGIEASVTTGRTNGRGTRSGRMDRANPSRINVDKPIFTLSVAADILGLHPRTLRIYEEHGLVVPHRTHTQRRRYSQNDIKKFQFIQHLTRDRGVNLNGVKIILLMLDELKKTITDPVRFIFPEYQDAN
jgi:hypothetical protein